MHSVELINVTKTYVNRRGQTINAVRGLNWSIGPGASAALLGPKGSGKRTLMRLLAGHEPPTSGEILLAGASIRTPLANHLDVVTITGSSSLFSDLSVAENLVVPLRCRGHPAQTRATELNSVVELLEIGHLLELTPDQLTPIQAQWVALGRAFIGDPALVILDEPFERIDPAQRLEIFLKLRAVQRELKLTMLFSTEFQNDALALADQLGVINDGTLQQVGTRDQLFYCPANEFVARFIGEPQTNFFSSTLVSNGQGLSLSSSRSAMVFVPDHDCSARLAAHGRRYLTVGLRPQRIFFQPQSENAHTISAEIQRSEFLGEMRLLTLKSGADSLQVIASSDAEFKVGHNRTLFYKSEDVMVFDPLNSQLLNCNDQLVQPPR